MKKLMFLLLVLTFALGIAACKDDAPEDTTVTFDDDFSENVELDVAINYAGTTFISYNRDTPYQAPNGKTYNVGDILPVWESIGDKWNVNFVDKATSSDSNTANQYTRMSADGFTGVDLINSTGADLSAAGQRGEFVDLAQYLDYMPNLKAFLDANAGVKASMTAADGGIYFTPYFDGFQEVERMNLMRYDWVKDLLDPAEGAVFDTTSVTTPLLYQKNMPDSLTTTIETGSADGLSLSTITKSYTQNIIDILDNLSVRNGATIAQALRDYIDSTYGNQYTNRADLFIGDNAAYDSDEMVALMRAVAANPLYLTREQATPLSHVDVLFPRDNTRINNLQFFAQDFGVRGFESRNEAFYFNTDGTLADGRATEANWDAIDRVSHLYNEGLIY